MKAGQSSKRDRETERERLKLYTSKHFPCLFGYSIPQLMCSNYIIIYFYLILIQFKITET